MSGKDFFIGKDKIDLSKIQGFVYKEEFAEEAQNDSSINSIFEKIDGVLDGKPDGKIDNKELEKLVNMLGFSAGDDNTLSKKELKNFSGFHGFQGFDIKEITNFMNLLIGKLSPEKMEKKIKDSFLSENNITEDILNEFYELDIKNCTYNLKKFENEEQEREYHNKMCSNILEKIRPGVSRKDIPGLKEQGISFKGSLNYVGETITTKDYKIVFRRNGSSNSGFAEFYTLHDEGGKTKEKLFNAFAINNRGMISQNASNKILLDLFYTDTPGAKELIMERMEKGPQESDPIQNNIKSDLIRKLISLNESTEVESDIILDENGYQTEVLVDNQEKFNKFLSLMDSKELAIFTEKEYVQKNGLKIHKSIDAINEFEDYASLLETSKFFKYDDTKLDGKINSWSDIRQSGFGNCWQISGLQSLLLSEVGKDFVNNNLLNIKDDKNEITINTALRTQTFNNETVTSIPEFLSEDSDKDAIGVLRTIRSFETEEDNTYIETDYTGGNLKNFAISVFGPKAKNLIKELSTKEEIVAFLRNNMAAINSHKYLTQFGFGTNYSIGDVDLKINSAENPEETTTTTGSFLENHAYTIYSVTKDDITLIDPNKSETITVAIKDILNNPEITLDYGNIEKLINLYKNPN